MTVKERISIGGYYGGKSQSVKKILPYLPPCTTFVSPFCGFASVGLNSPVEQLILNDANPATAAGLLAIRDDVETLIDWLKYSRWDTENFEWCKAAIETASAYPFSGGYAAIAYSFMAHGRGGSRSGYSAKQAARPMKKDWSYLRQISDRLQSATILSKDFRHCFSREFVAALPADSAYYLDPPYLDGGEHYQVTMDADDHVDMLKMAIACPYPVVISGYASKLYDRYLKSWERVEFPAQNNHRQKRVEVLWIKSQ